MSDTQTLAQLLQLIADHPQQLEFAGFMGYDPFAKYFKSPRKTYSL